MSVDRISHRCSENLSIRHVVAPVALDPLKPFYAEGKVCVRPFYMYLVGTVHQFFQFFHLA